MTRQRYRPGPRGRNAAPHPWDPSSVRRRLAPAPLVGEDGAMPGVIIIAVVLVVVMPVSVLMSGAVASALLGYFLKDEADTSHEGSELLETNY